MTDPAKLYQKALKYFVLTKYNQAAANCNKLIARLPTPSSQDDHVELRRLTWTLFLNISAKLRSDPKLLGLPTHDSNEKYCRAVWELLLEIGYAGDPSQLDPRLVSSSMVLCLQFSAVKVAREIAEQWYASLPDVTIEYLVQNQDMSNPVYAACMNTIEIYLLKILGGMEDYHSAAAFLEYNGFISQDKKKILEMRLEQLKEAAKERERKKLALAKAKAAELEKAKKMELVRQQEQERLRKAAAAASIPSPPLEVESSVPSASTNVSASNEKQEAQREIQARSTSSSSLVKRNQMAILADRLLSMIKTWLNHIVSNGSAAYMTILLLAFSLIAVLRNQSRFPVVKALISKIWQTVQMGTKVTYL